MHEQRIGLHPGCSGFHFEAHLFLQEGRRYRRLESIRPSSELGMGLPAIVGGFLFFPVHATAKITGILFPIFDTFHKSVFFFLRGFTFAPRYRIISTTASLRAVQRDRQEQSFSQGFACALQSCRSAAGLFSCPKGGRRDAVGCDGCDRDGSCAHAYRA